MRHETVLITSLAAAALAVIVLIGCSSSASGPTGSSAAATSASATTSAPAATSSAAASPTIYPVLPTMANFAGMAQNGHAAVAVAIHGDKAIAYICNGPTVASWFQGTALGRTLELTGENHAQLSLTIDSTGMMRGGITVHGTSFKISMLPMVHDPAGLYEATAMVRGHMVEAGWIVLSNGEQIGSILINPAGPAPTVISAPPLNLAADTATYDGVVLRADDIDGVSGSGF